MMSTKKSAMPVMTTDWVTASPTPAGPRLAVIPLYEATTAAINPKMAALSVDSMRSAGCEKRGETVQETARRAVQDRDVGEVAAGDGGERDDAVEQHGHDDGGQHAGRHQSLERD